MPTNFTKILGKLILLMLLPALPALAQNTSVTVGKQVGRIPKVCESVVPASIEATVDIPALVKEADCKGAGDMIVDYSYVMNTQRRAVDKKGQTKEGSTTYEVFIPTLKSGTRGKGILVVTARDGVPAPAAELEKARTEAGERLEKAEVKNAREHLSLPLQIDPNVKGMLPLGMYTYTTNTRSSLFKKRGVRLGIHSFLRNCELTLIRRGTSEGREILVFSFKPRPDAQFDDYEKYIAQLTGEIWIDAQDRIVTRLTGWPTVVAGLAGATNATPASGDRPAAPVSEPRAVATGSRINPMETSLLGERPPAVYVEMQRLPENIWLPRVIRINGADYPTLFDEIDTESISVFSNYIRFSTDVKDVKINSPGNP